MEEKKATAKEKTMVKEGGELEPEKNLRRQAEDLLRNGKGSLDGSNANDCRDNPSLVHELQVHQVELEMQNESLRHAQLETKDALAKYSDLYNFAPIGLFTLDMQGAVVEVNHAGAELLGQGERNLMHRNFRLFVSPEDRLSFNGFLKKTLETSVKQTGDFMLVRNDESTLYAHIVGIAAKDRLSGCKQCQIAVTDITERKKAEEALQKNEECLRIAKRAAKLGIYDFDVETGEVHADERACELWGMRPEEAITYESFMASLHPEDRAPAQSAMDAALDPQGSGEYNAEYRIISRLDGIERWVAAIGQVFFDQSKPTRLVGTVRDITERKRSEDALQKSEARIRQKLESILSPAGDIGELELADIIDAKAIQTLMDSFYELAHIPMSIDDLKGEVLVGIGWQDICTKFHRVNPETCRHCMESDLELSKGIPPGEFRLYKCKNNMWDMATPIMIGGQHVGNLYVGQFFFEDEPLDYVTFRSQARLYGFDEAEYIAALDKVPRLKKESVDIARVFFQKLAQLISQLSYSNIKLARSLAVSDDLRNALQESQKDLNRAQAVAHTGSWRIDVLHNELLWSDETYRMFGIPKGTPLTYETFLASVHPDDREYIDWKWKAALKDEPYDIEHRIVVGESVKWVRERAEMEFSTDGHLLSGFGTVQDITERKMAEREREQILDKLSYERALLNETLKQMPAGVIVAEANSGMITLANDQIKKLLRSGSSPMETIEQHGDHRAVY